MKVHLLLNNYFNLGGFAWLNRSKEEKNCAKNFFLHEFFGLHKPLHTSQKNFAHQKFFYSILLWWQVTLVYQNNIWEKSNIISVVSSTPLS